MGFWRLRGALHLINSLSIDVEEWFHPELLRDKVAPEDRKGRVDVAIQPLLGLLDRFKVKASFFFLGEVASENPRLVQKLHKEGHEIASHGMFHHPLWVLGRERFRQEMKEFIDLMQKILGNVRIHGFRAPTFSLDTETQWALPILRDLGFSYDASLFPAKLWGNRLYGVNGAPRVPYRISMVNLLEEDFHSPLMEFPNTVLSFGGFSIPLAGGFYLRAIPLRALIMGLKRVNRLAPFNLYIHPWEVDPQTPRLPLDLKSRWITYYGIDSALNKLEGLLTQFSFSRVDEVLASTLQIPNSI
jgi:polysaccharide deacetylase family protein (PEP-CTERM system associated)